MLISIDVGIKNLAYCVISGTAAAPAIESWGVINLCGEQARCVGTTRKGVCGKNATYQYSDKCYCGTHVKKCGAEVAPNNYYKMLKSKKPSKKLIAEMKALLPANDNTPTDEICNAITQRYATKLASGPSASDMDLVDIGISMSSLLPKSIDMTLVTRVAIENQISPIANRMKCIQGMLTQFFIERGITNVSFVSSSNKLRKYQVPKKTYKERKASGIVVARERISEMPLAVERLKEFDEHKKKDDLADALLQGLWTLDN